MREETEAHETLLMIVAEYRQGSTSAPENLLRLRETLHRVSYDVDATFVGRVELQAFKETSRHVKKLCAQNRIQRTNSIKKIRSTNKEPSFARVAFFQKQLSCE